MNAEPHHNSLCLSGSLCLSDEGSRRIFHHRNTKVTQRHKEILLAIVMLLAMAWVPSSQGQVAQPLEDPAIEARMKHLTRELRCLVCQSEALAESNADFAKELRGLIREQLKAGKSDEEILAFVSQRYGDYVLYNPPVKAKTYLLWFGPFVLLLGGTAFLYRYLKRRRELIEVKPLTAEERKRAERLLKEM